MANALAGKFRVRAVDETGKAVARVLVELVTPDSGMGAAPGEKGGSLAVLRSLHTSSDGFAIFSLDNLAAARVQGGLGVRFNGRSDLTYALGAAAHSTSKYRSFTLPNGTVPVLAHDLPMHWVDDGIDADDVWAIPGIFPDLGDLKFGDDYCGRLVPNDLTVRIFDRDQVIRTARNVLTGIDYNKVVVVAGRGKGGTATAGVGREDQISLSEGKLLHCQIKWTRLGYTFGDLLYSLPLAPCESVTLAVSHWAHRQQAQAEQSSQSAQGQTASYADQGTVADAMSAMSSSNQNTSAHGWAIGATTGSSASGILDGFLLKATSALGVSYASTKTSASDVRQFGSNATHSFSDSVQQAAEGWRRDHQIVVMEQTETQDQAISYRTVCNNNHCHVLNVFYHEVLNNFRVCSRFMGSRDVYFVPYGVRDFDEELALCAKPFLLPFLLDKDLVDCYDETKWAATPAAPPAPTMVNQFKIELKFDTIASDFWQLMFVVSQSGGSPQFSPVPVSVWNSNNTYSYIVNMPDLNPANLQGVGITIDKTGPGMFSSAFIAVNHFTISMMDPATGQWVPLGTGHPPPTVAHVSSSIPVSYVPPAHTAAAGTDCLSRLLQHLNCNRMYYNVLLWLTEDPNERIFRFDQIMFGNDCLTDLIIPEPLAVMGNYVVFAKAGSEFEPWTGDPVLDERLVTIPTPGIFADAALGKCTTCEPVNKDVYWDWKDTPCSCAGKDVTLATPSPTSLFPAGASPFLVYPTGLTNTLTPSGMGGTSTNSLVSAFGSALATAMFAGKDSTTQLTALTDLMTKLTDLLKDSTPDPGSGPEAKPETTPAAPAAGG